MNHNFICPCCGTSGKYSEELATKIFNIVCDYYNVTTDAALGYKLHQSKPEAKAKYFTAYFIRMLTGEPYKVISAFFGRKTKSTIAGEFVAVVQRRIINDIEWFKDYVKIKKLLFKTEKEIISQ